MTKIDHYHDRMAGETDAKKQWRQMNYIEPFEEQSPHTSEETHVLQRGESIPVTEQEDEAFERLMQLAGIAE